MSPDEITALAHAQEEAHLARLAVYEAKAATVTNPNHAAVVHAGLLHERTFAEFWREISATPP
jgi:hypothetical protein